MLLVDPKRCCYCYECVLACSFFNEGIFSPAMARIKVLESKEGYGIPLICLQCSAHPCVDVCPTEALRLEGGIVKVKEEICIGCGTCEKACPIGAIWVFNGKAIKCELCSPNPPCAKYCPTGAIKTTDSPEKVEESIRFIMTLRRTS
ncbi:MAG TPA: 4Fe-4S dicluster domain-containing protein [Candidatus Korarchaeota archaeon]|nr:4Fe-4S dicluster domain-containing protein [Candidatus Korarchaeota archaeon]